MRQSCALGSDQVPLWKVVFHLLEPITDFHQRMRIRFTCSEDMALVVKMNDFTAI